jgi:putative oxidoreductase
MKVVGLIARYLLGLIFVVFGANGFLHFIPMAPPSGLAGQYMGALFMSHILVVVFLLELIPGILLLVGRYVPLALVLLGPVIVNIALFHAMMEPSGLPIASVVVILWLLTFWSYRAAFEHIFQHKHEAA